MPPSKKKKQLALLAGRKRFFAIGGLPSANSVLVFHVVSEILRRTYGSASLHAFNIMNQKDLSEFIDKNDQAIIYYDFPDKAMVDFIREGKFPRLIVEDSFYDTAIYCMVARKMTSVGAARFVSQSMSCLEDILQSKGVRLIPVPHDMAIADWIDGISAVMGIDPVDWEGVRSAMHADYAHFGTVGNALLTSIQFAAEAAAFGDNLKDDELAFLKDLSAGYAQKDIRHIHWSVETLLDGTPPYGPVEEVIDAVGPARVLTFGPHFHLPSGRWSASYAFEAWENQSSNSYGFDLYADGELKFSTKGIIDTSAGFEVRCEFELDDPSHAIDFRCVMNEGAIAGRFRPLGITIRRQSYVLE